MTTSSPAVSLLVETDLIVEFLNAPAGEVPLLRRLLQVARCYSTFIQAAELYSVTRGDDDRRTVDRALFGLKILGASSRYSKTIGEVLSSLGSMRGHRIAIVAAMAIESRIPVVTDTYFHGFSAIPGLRTVSASLLRQANGRPELEEALMRIG